MLLNTSKEKDVEVSPVPINTSINPKKFSSIKAQGLLERINRLNNNASRNLKKRGKKNNKNRNLL